MRDALGLRGVRGSMFMKTKQMERLLTACALLGGGLLQLGCGGRTQTSQGPDTSTHWLSSCEEDDDCGSLSCVCGVCTRKCDDTVACSGLGESAVCAEVSECNGGQVCATTCDGGACLGRSNFERDVSSDTTGENTSTESSPSLTSSERTSSESSTTGENPPSETSASSENTSSESPSGDECVDVLSTKGEARCLADVAICDQLEGDDSQREFVLELAVTAPNGEPYTSEALSFNAGCLLDSISGGVVSRVDNTLHVLGTWSDIAAFVDLAAVAGYSAGCEGDCDYCLGLDEAACNADVFCRPYLARQKRPELGCQEPLSFYSCLPHDLPCDDTFFVGMNNDDQCWIFPQTCPVFDFEEDFILDDTCELSLGDAEQFASDLSCADGVQCYSPEDDSLAFLEGSQGCECDYPSSSAVCTSLSFSCVNGHWEGAVDGICFNGSARCDRVLPTMGECLNGYFGCVLAEEVNGYCAVEAVGGGERPTFTQQDCIDWGGSLSDYWDPANLWVTMTTAEQYCAGPEGGIAAEACEAKGGRVDCLGPTDAFRPLCEGDETPIVELSDCGSSGYCCVPDQTAP